MTPTSRLLTAAGLMAATLGLHPGRAAADDVVLVHGLNSDGGVWRAAFDRLTADGHDVVVAQLPLTSVEDDVAAVRRLLAAQDGPVVLVGHSYGGMVISQAGTAPKVEALVYVAAFQPEVGESLGALNASAPAALPQDAVQVFEDGFYLIEPEAWMRDVAGDLPDAEARFTAQSQAASNTAIFAYEAEAAAWRDTPTWIAVAAADRTVAPELQRRMAERSGATVVEIEGGHLLPMSHPDEVAALIEEAAAAVE